MRSKGKPTFINFDKRYPSQDFTVMIWGDDRPGFGDLEIRRPPGLHSGGYYDLSQALQAK